MNTQAFFFMPIRRPIPTSYRADILDIYTLNAVETFVYRVDIAPKLLKICCFKLPCCMQLHAHHWSLQTLDMPTVST